MPSPSGANEDFIAAASESQARAEAVLPSEGSEDATHLLHQWVVDRPGNEPSDEGRDYLPNGKIDWVVHLDFPPQTILKKASIQQVFSQGWREKHAYPVLFGYTPEEKRWTYVNAAGVPDLYSALQLAWKLRSLDDDERIASDRLRAYLAAARHAGQTLKATGVRPATSPEDAARQSFRLLELVESCDSHPAVVLKAVSVSGFDGREIWDVMLCLGLRWGDMDLFHWENPGIPGDDHLFSVWTSTPPGYFFPEEIAAGRIHTTDLVFGFSVPRTWQPIVVVESMLRTVHYTERRLGGRVLDVDGADLSEEELKAEVREIVTRLTDAGFPPGSGDALYTEILAAADNSAGSAARKAIEREIATRLRIDPKVKEAMTAAFAVVLEEFRDATLKDSAVLASVGRQVHGVTGGQMREFALRLQDAAPRPLTVEQILAWADSHYEEKREWPRRDSGPVLGEPDEAWSAVDSALRMGVRGFVGGSSLAKFLAEKRGVRNPGDLPPLTGDEILIWADRHHAQTGEWPKVLSGAVTDIPGETWQNVHAALVNGLRGLPRGSSLAQLLAEGRGVRNRADLPPLAAEQIVAWADAFHARTNKWPGQNSGAIEDAPGETWKGVSMALIQGQRGLETGSTLAKLLEDHRGVRNPSRPPDLAQEEILQWADAYFDETGEWPTPKSGAVGASPADTWSAVNAALALGGRGLRGGSSLAKLLAKERGRRYVNHLPALTHEIILAWADAYFEKIGTWPNDSSGSIDGVPGQTWKGVAVAMIKGLRGLPRASSLKTLLQTHRGIRNRMSLPELTQEQILAWADAHHGREGTWPKVKSGAVVDAPDETWLALNHALDRGIRGLPGGSSLAKLLCDKRGVRNRMELPELSEEQIMAWVDEYRAHFGRNPTRDSGLINGAVGEAWSAIDAALKSGARGLPGGCSLSRLIKNHRTVSP
jgi:hypothetical protein